VGVNLSPDKKCNFDCIYCEVNHAIPVVDTRFDPDQMAAELQRMLALVHADHLRDHPHFGMLPPDLRQLKHVTLSGDGEPTLCPQFVEAVQAVMHIRAVGQYPFFKIVLITNATGLDQPRVREGLKFFTPQDEVWAKVDAGTQAYMDYVNKPQVPLEKVLANILQLGRERPIIIQSLFCSVDGQEPSADEIHQYACRLAELKNAGARISMVQVYSASRRSVRQDCHHLPLRALSRIAQAVRETAGLRVEVF
jgi:wyosine [tRNA(Phe)-imidazoG37] synthetase (radical SAM superfamily)